MWLPWNYAVVLAALCVALWAMLRTGDGGRQRVVRGLARETALILVLYAIWQFAGGVSVMQATGADHRGRRIVEIQRAWHLPSEVSLQHLILPHPLLVQFANGYYAIAHVPALLVFLIWAFLHDRHRYARWRTVLAMTTGACLAVQLIPVAPPRMLTDLGFVDTALLYQQSVYSALGRGMAGQLAAMPSVHVAWAVIVALGTWSIATGAGRWVGVIHALATILVVSATANHYWADGMVAVALIGVSMLVYRAATTLTLTSSWWPWWPFRTPQWTSTDRDTARRWIRRSS